MHLLMYNVRAKIFKHHWTDENARNNEAMAFLLSSYPSEGENMTDTHTYTASSHRQINNDLAS